MDKISLWFVAAYISVFLMVVYQNRQFKWLVTAIGLWVVLRMVGGILVWHEALWAFWSRLSLVYMPYFYIVLSSLVVFMCCWRRLPDSSFWHIQGGKPFLGLFAVSGMLMLVAYVVLLVLVGWQFPEGLTPYVLPALLQMYVFDPVYWVCMQAVVMSVFYLHRVMLGKQSANYFSGKQLQAGFLLALLLQVAYVMSSLSQMAQ